MTKTRTLRDLRIAARDGDPAAVRAVLRQTRHPELAGRVHRGKPIPPFVWKFVLAATAGTGTATELTEWEERRSDGSITNLLLDRPRSEQRQRAIMED